MDREQSYRARDKITHKMTRDGLIEQNLTTGEHQRVSQRGQEFMLTNHTDERLSVEKVPIMQSDRKRRLRRKHSPAATPATDAPIIDKPVSHTRREHIRSRFRIENVGADIVSGMAHQKLSELEQDNSGLESVHKPELAAESVIRTAFSFGRRHKRGREMVAEHSGDTVKASASSQTGANHTSNGVNNNRRTTHDNPNQKSNPISRLLQKQKLKRRYAAAARQAKSAGQTVQTAENLLQKVAKRVAGTMRRHPILLIAILFLLLFVFIVSGMFSSCANMSGGGFASIIMSSYLAEDSDIDAAELAYTGWETDLQLEINNAEINHPGYDEYRYEIDDISHNPFELMAYLTARYQSFEYADVAADLTRIFDEQYDLEYIEEIEIRYRQELRTDPDTGESYMADVPYEWHILNIKLTVKSFTDIVTNSMSGSETEMYGLYMETRGNRQYIISPFDFNWIPYITEYYGWRVHPDTGAKDYHKGVDIAVPIGTDVLAGHDGRMATVGFDAGAYGWYAVINDDNGLESKYAHCSTILVSEGQEVKRGDVIAKSGNTGNAGSEPHLHLEVVKNGEYLNPLYFAESEYGAVNIPEGYPGAPMDNAAFAALMEEAMKHLGKPYVFGASGPDKFDCSGFVSYVLNHSGVADVGRRSAQGLYNASTPVSRENAQPGDLIFFEGTRSASVTVTHVAIYIGNGQMIHAGKPVQYASIDTKYWREHFYSFGRIL